MTKIIEADAAKLAGLQIDLLQKMRQGHITPGHLEWFNGLSRSQRDMVSGADLKALTPALLTPVTTILVPAPLRFVARDHFIVDTRRFVARDHFIVDTSEKAKVKIGWLGENFKRNFLDKVEDLPYTNLAIYTLTRDSLDDPIREALGDKAETSLFHLWHLLSRQGKGQQGVLLVNGYANVFYIRDTDGELWAVDAHWIAYCGVWFVGAYSVSCPDGWDAGDRVVSRESACR